jgi:hypothetical protein
MGQMRNILVGKPEEERQLGKPGRRWEDIREIRWEFMDWINLVRNKDEWRALVNTIMNIQVP